jgi:ATP-binding cassette subfamily F protein 3
MGDVVMTSHDRQFMTRICKRTVEVANAQVTSYSGDYDFYIREREIRREQLIATYNRQQARFAKDEEFIAKFAARASHASLVPSVGRKRRVGSIRFSSISAGWSCGATRLP